MSSAGPIDPVDGIEPGRRLVRFEGDKGQSLAEKLANKFHILAWRTPLHSLRLRGRYPLKLLGVPADPVDGNVKAGQAMLQGRIEHMGESIDIAGLDFKALNVSPAFVEYLQSFAWLRDLAAAAPRDKVAPVAELLVRRWLVAFGNHVGEAGWRADLWGRRILFWGANAPLILSSSDIVYRSAVLNGLARGARHLDRGADKAAQGLPRVAAWAGVVGAGLLIPGGDVRLVHGEAGLARALNTAMHSDGGVVSRSPVAQLELISILSLLRSYYAMRNIEACFAVTDALARAVPALLGITMGDGGLSSWQGDAPIDSQRVTSIVTASGVRARPASQARDWGYQRLAAGQTRIVMDAAPPPVSRMAKGGCASTLAFELSDGPRRLIINCGGGRGVASNLPDAFLFALRSTAAHSTLVIADSNSTAVLPDGLLGKGVAEVELDRVENDTASRVEASHDGYARRYGFLHRRQIALSADGRDVQGEDVLLPGGRRLRPKPVAFAVRFHLAPGVEIAGTADGMGALLRIPEGAMWQFRCRGGELAVEDSVWIDPQGRPRGTRQLVITGESPAGGAHINWLLRRAG